MKTKKPAAKKPAPLSVQPSNSMSKLNMALEAYKIEYDEAGYRFYAREFIPSYSSDNIVGLLLAQPLPTIVSQDSPSFVAVISENPRPCVCVKGGGFDISGSPHAADLFKAPGVPDFDNATRLIIKTFSALLDYVKNYVQKHDLLAEDKLYRQWVAKRCKHAGCINLAVIVLLVRNGRNYESNSLCPEHVSNYSISDVFPVEYFKEIQTIA